ncbi:hypothetical protein EV672_10264 [Aquabacterium commune]|uniref:Uncharacterized protein n=2 Tax=Aquabacterium commune TaxID=70586 RepID=A0A4R6RHQ5_9BURK|nr:hypothetical protein EV672_10264 [Aquabacterium commune]
MLVPGTYRTVETIRGDLNKDGHEDVVLLVKATDQKMVVTGDDGKPLDRNRRGLIIAFKKGPSYDVVLSNLQCFSSENEDGGVYFPPELEVRIDKGNFYIGYSHGRYGHWRYNFRYQNAGFELIGYDSSSHHGPVVERALSVNILANKVVRRVNTNHAAQGGDERFKEIRSTIQRPKTIRLGDIPDFDELSVERTLGISP